MIYISHIYSVCIYISLTYPHSYMHINLLCTLRHHQSQHHPRRAPGQNHLPPALWLVLTVRDAEGGVPASSPRIIPESLP